MTLHHTHDSSCPLCEDKLLGVFPYLRKWFRKVKKKFPWTHISWGYRGKADQEQAFLEGKTHCHYPNSPHNRVDSEGRPESYALDLFKLEDSGIASFEKENFAEIMAYIKECQDEVIWGGNFKSLGDSNHFQFNPNRFS